MVNGSLGARRELGQVLGSGACGAASGGVLRNEREMQTISRVVEGSETRNFPVTP